MPYIGKAPNQGVRTRFIYQATAGQTSFSGSDANSNTLTYSVQDWCDNAIHNRARIAQEEIIAKLVEHCNANSIAIATGSDAQVAQAFELKVVDTAKNVSDNTKNPE